MQALLVKLVIGLSIAGVGSQALATPHTPPKPNQPVVAATQSPVVTPEAPVTQEFGENPEAYRQFGIEAHNGRDIGLKCGEDVKAHSSGIVKLTGNDPKGYGKFTVIHDNLSYLHLQGHYQIVLTKTGDYVEKGQVIGKAGSTGNSTGCHEHWGVKGASADNGFGGYIDPRDWITMREKREKEKTCLYDVPIAYAEVICEAVKKYPADPAVVAAFLFWEHRGFEASPKTYDWGSLCSHAGACGAGQFMPATFAAYGVDGDGDGKANRASFEDSVYSAANLLGKYAGTTPDTGAVELAAIKYNCGPGCVGHALPDETAQYKKAVVNLWWKFGSN